MTGQAVDQAVHVGFIKAAQRQARHALLATQVGEHLGERVRARQLAFPIGADHAERRTVRGAHDVTEHEQCRFVGPMQIVEHEQHRVSRGGLREKCTDRFEQPVPLSFRIHRRRGRKTGYSPEQFWDQRS